MFRRFVAFAGHAPGLWLLYREPIPKPLRVPNAIAAGATLFAMGLGGVLGGEARWTWVGALWLAGHVLWGLYLAIRLPAAAGE